MKFFVVTLILAVALTITESRNIDTDIDWSKVKPIEHYPHFWDDKPASLRPPASFFESLEKERSGRIVGGYEATRHQFPYICSVVVELSAGGLALCGGSLLSESRVMTAAHCVDAVRSATVILGAHNRTFDEPTQRRFVSSSFIIHPSWDPNNLRNDIAMIIPPARIEMFDRVISPVRLPTAAHVTLHFVGEMATVSGWGRFSDSNPQVSDVLRFTTESIISNTACSARFPTTLQSTNICMNGGNGRGSCGGDSGGPLTVLDNGSSMMIGIVSFGSTGGCETNWPSVYTRVTSYFSWISQNLQ